MTPLLQLWSGQRDGAVMVVSYASSCGSDSEKWLWSQWSISALTLAGSVVSNHREDAELTSWRLNLK